MSKRHFCIKTLSLGLFLLQVIGSSYSLKAQNFLEIPVRLDIDKGDFDNVVVKVKKEGKDAFTQSGASKMRFKLDFSKKYSLIFTKPGYITKTIEVNTTAPSSRISKGFDPYKIGVKMYKQGEENTVVYNQPVAKIKFDENLDDFSFETDYSKSILSAMNTSDKEADETDKPALEKPKGNTTAKETEQPTQSSTASGNNSPPSNAITASTESGPQSSIETNESIQENIETPLPYSPSSGMDISNTASGNGNEETNKIAGVSAGEDYQKRSSMTAGEDNQKGSDLESGIEKPTVPIVAQSGTDLFSKKNTVQDGSDNQGTPAINFENEKITREDIIEKNRIITKVIVIKGTLSTEYRRVNYKWGGRYFFKDNTMSIPENLFVQWTGVNN